MANPNKINKVAIAGAGGIGANLCRIFYEYGAIRNQFPYDEIKVDVYDDDVIEASNLLHQDYSGDDLGKSKANVMADRYIYNPVNRFMLTEDFSKYDLIFSCVDSMAFRKSLYEYHWANENTRPKFWIDGRCNSTQCASFNSTMPRIALEKYITNDDTRGSCLAEFEKQNNVCHTTPLVAASAMIQAFLNIYRGEEYSAGMFLNL